MNALYCYLAGSLVFLAGGVRTDAPFEYVMGSMLFATGAIAAIVEAFRK